MKPTQKPNSRKPKRAVCECGRPTEVYHNTNWICAVCAARENHRCASTAPRDRSIRLAMPEYAVLDPEIDVLRVTCYE